MKLDKYNCLIREKYQPEHHPGNLGDSLAETARLHILENEDAYYGKYDAFKLNAFSDVAAYDINAESTGFALKKESRDFGFVAWCRHPIANVWGVDISSDQVLPLVLGYHLSIKGAPKKPRWFLPGTSVLVSPGLWCAYRGYYKLLNIVNIIQGLLFLFPWRWSDDKKFKGKFWKVERSHGKVQDYLNYLCIFIALKRKGKWATLVTPKAKCMSAVKKYYLEGEDVEPNSQWLVDLYERALNEYA